MHVMCDCSICTLISYHLRQSKDCFYFPPLQKLPGDPTKPWFSAIPVGWNKLDRMVKEMLEAVNIADKSDHSLHVTGVTRMYKHGIQEKTSSYF